MQKSFNELVDISKIQLLMDALYEATGISSVILDNKLNTLIATTGQDICAKFHSIQAKTEAHYKRSSNSIAQNLDEEINIEYRCKNGMFEYACPIIGEGEHLVTLCMGQVFTEPPQEDVFRQQARKYGFDEEAYIAALRKVPVIKEEVAKIIIKFFVELVKNMVDNANRQLETFELLQNLIEAIPNPVFYKDKNGVYQGCNQAFTDFFGRGKNEIIGSTVYDNFPKELAAKYEAMDSELLSNPQVQTYEYQAINSHREKRDVIFNKAPYLGLNGQVAGLIGLIVDVTEKKQLERELKSSEEKYRALFNHLFNGVGYCERVLDENNSIVDYTILEVNTAFEKLIGLDKKELVGKRVSETIFSAQRGTINWISMFNDVLVSKKTNTMELFSSLLQKWLLISAYSPQSGYCAVVVSDITEQKKSIEQAQYYSYHDPLTGLPNRRLFDDRLSLAIAQRNRDGGKIAVAFLDLDKFKQVNDTLGHGGGDLLLKEVAKRFLACIREGDTVSRIGGDEFVFILPDFQEYDDLRMIVARILEACKQPFHINNQVVEMSASIGVSFFPQDGDDITSLTRNADSAMYLCKEQGRDGICYSNRANRLKTSAEYINC